MKELWTANPFHLMNRPFAEMGYNSSGLNIVPERLLLATRRPSMHYPLASGAPSFGPLRATCRRATNHLQHTAQHLATPPQATCRRSAQHLAAPCTASAISPQTIRHLAARHPLAPAPRPSALCKPSTRQFTARYPPAHRKPSAVVLHNIWRSPANHPPSHGTASADPRASPAGTLQTSAGTNRRP